MATDFFTVLSTGQHFTEDQWLNVQAFSMLRAWLLHSSPEGTGPADTDDRSELEGSTLSVLSAATSTSRLLPPQERLRDKAFEYCQRLIEQSNRRECPGRWPPPAVSCLGLLLFPRGLLVFRHHPQGAEH